LGHKIIFVGGIHGAGKTTVSRRLAATLSASHVTAGTLIRESATFESSSTQTANKTVSDVNSNQELLLRGLARYRGTVTGALVLDGHFSLIHSSGVPVAIPMAIYIAIAPIAIVLIESDSQIVHSRLLQRDGTAPPAATISSLSECERANAHSVSEILKIPMFLVRGDIPADEAFQNAASELLPLIRGAA
jgi:adenylate kinase